jgi:hypothetical protein
MIPKGPRKVKQQNSDTSSQTGPRPPTTGTPPPSAFYQRIKDELAFAAMLSKYVTERSSAPSCIIKTQHRDSDPSETEDQRMNSSCINLGGWVTLGSGSGSGSGSESQSQPPLGLTKRQIPAELPQIEGGFMPPGGGNPNPPPNSIIFREFATWSHLPPPYLPGVNIHEGDPATAPRKIITSIDGIYPNTMRDTPSPPSEQTLIQDTGASGAEEGFSTPTEPYREMCTRGPRKRLETLL